MWLFWILAGGLAAVLAVVVLARAAGAARRAASQAEDPALPVYRRQLAELDELDARGLMGPEELQAARAEAARRLLSAADRSRPAETAGGRGARMIVVLGAAGAGLTALCLYLLLGSPGLPDQPYRARVQAWRRSDPSVLDPARMAAVLRDVVHEHPRDAQAYDYLGRAQEAAGDNFAAAQAFQHAIDLAPNRADLRVQLGVAWIADSEGQIPPKAQAAFRQALALDPQNAAARYFLARAEIAGGQVQQGLAAWRALAADMPAADPRRLELLRDIARVASIGTPAAVAAPPEPAEAQASAPVAPGAGQMAFIQSMVAKQVADLETHPDDPDGWARLVRAYGVLGRPAAQQQALAKARTIFRGRPDVLARIEAEAAPSAAPAPAPVQAPGG